APIDRRRGILTPGLVNAHTHLQYTGFDAVGRGGYADFEHWSEVFGEAYDAVTNPDQWRRDAHEGARQAIRSGSTVFAEIVTNDEARGVLHDEHVGGIEYLEEIGQHVSGWRAGAREQFIARLDAPSPVR